MKPSRDVAHSELLTAQQLMTVGVDQPPLNQVIDNCIKYYVAAHCPECGEEIPRKICMCQQAARL